MSNQRQASFREEQWALSAPVGQAFSPTNTISTVLPTLSDETPASYMAPTRTSPMTTTPTLVFLAQVLLTDPPESEGIQDKWLRGWS